MQIEGTRRRRLRKREFCSEKQSGEKNPVFFLFCQIESDCCGIMLSENVKYGMSQPEVMKRASVGVKKALLGTWVRSASEVSVLYVFSECVLTENFSVISE